LMSRNHAAIALCLPTEGRIFFRESGFFLSILLCVFIHYAGGLEVGPQSFDEAAEVVVVLLDERL
jgi:hypothetical protein